MCLLIIGIAYTGYQLKNERAEVEKQMDDKGMALAKIGAQSIQAITENDLKAKVLSHADLFD